jgi:hypothetical protein
VSTHDALPPLCEVQAHWSYRGLISRLAFQGEPVATPDRPATIAAGAWTPPDLDDIETVDEETVAALLAGEKEGLPTSVDAAGVRVPSDGVAFLIDHQRPAIGLGWAVTRSGDTFSASGVVAAEHYAALQARPFVSEGLRVRKARLVDLGAGVRYVEATEVLLYELSATAEPLAEGTMLLAGAPGTHWLAQRFSGEDYHAGRFRVAFPATVTVVR